MGDKVEIQWQNAIGKYFQMLCTYSGGLMCHP